jgi:hypothetical protein
MEDDEDVLIGWRDTIREKSCPIAEDHHGVMNRGLVVLDCPNIQTPE